MTDPPATLAAALARVQAEIPVVAKTKTAKLKGKSKAGLEFDYSYKYADLADVTAAIMPLLGKNGLSFTCMPDQSSGKFGLRYLLMHADGDAIGGFYPLDETMTPQQIGGHITYARRYCLCAITGLSAEEDTDAQGAQAAATQAARKPRGTPPERAPRNLPRNADGSLRRSEITDPELAAAGAMTDAQLRDHNKLERDVKGTDAKGRSEPQAERLATTPPDDLWTEPLRTPHAAPPKAGQIHAHFKRLGFTDEDRDDRLKAMSAITGRTIRSTNDLTAAEGIDVADLLAKCRDRSALIERLAVKAGEDT